jgi:hypothetical protein
MRKLQSVVPNSIKERLVRLLVDTGYVKSEKPFVNEANVEFDIYAIKEDFNIVPKETMSLATLIAIRSHLYYNGHMEPIEFNRKMKIEEAMGEFFFDEGIELSEESLPPISLKKREKDRELYSPTIYHRVTFAPMVRRKSDDELFKIVI